MDGQIYISPLALLKRFCVNVFCRRDIDGSLNCLSKDIHWYGTADGGDIHVGVDEDVVVGVGGLDFFVQFFEDGLQVVAEAHDDVVEPVL